MKFVSRKEAWKVMRNTFHDYDKKNKRSLYFVVALFTFIVGLLLILDRTVNSVIIALNTITIIAMGIGYNLSFDSLRASLAENKILRQKFSNQTESERS